MPKTATKRPMTLAEYKAKNEKANKDTRSPLAKAVGWDANKTQFIRDLLTGGNDVAGRGMIAGMLGAPGDIAGLAENGLRGLLGKPQVQPWGGSEHIGQTLEQAGLVSDVRRPKTELLASLISPGAAAKTVLNAPKTAMTALRWMDNLDSAPTMARIGQRGAIDVWHGSPHKFEQFKAMDNVGAGEGAQAYGHGGYHASDRGVANFYKDALSNRKYMPGSASSPLKSAWSIVGADAKTAAMPTEELLPFVKRAWPDVPDDEIRVAIEEAKSAFTPGYLYRNQLRWPDPAREASDPLSDKHFLDWDKPLSEQSPEVQQALSAYNDFRQTPSISPEMTGADIYKLFQNRNPQSHVLPNNVINHDFGQAGATKDLNFYGIPGIRYLDGGSRSAGAGTHNYVTFDDSLVNILERNGQPVTAPQPGLLGGQITRKP